MSLELVNGAVLLPDPADWTAGCSLTLQWQTKIVAGGTGLEDRAALRDRPSAIMRWQLTASRVAANALLTTRIRRALDGGAAAAPCHSRPTNCVAATSAMLTLEATPWPWATGDWLLIGGTAHQVAAVAGQTLTLATPLETVPAAATPIYPLLFGRLQLDGAQQTAVRCRLLVNSWRIGDAPAPGQYRSLPVAPHLIASGVVRRSREALTASLASESELTAAESFIQAIGGSRDAFWLPDAEMAMAVAGTAPSGFTIVAQGFANEWDNAPEYCLWFAHPTLPPMAARVTAVAAGTDGTTEIVTLEEALPQAIDASWDVFRLRRVRLDDDRVIESTAANGVTTFKIAVTALPTGAGAGMRPAFLYRFQERLDATRIWRLTSHDLPVSYGGETYLPAAISHGEAFAVTCDRATLDLPEDGAIDASIRRVDLPDGAAQTLFTGRCGSVTWAGETVNVTLLPPADLAEGLLPSFRIGAACNHRLYGAACGLDPASWSVPCTLATLAAANVTLAADPGKPDNWFAGGRLIVGTERRAILASSGLQLLLSEPLRQAQPGDPATIFAGCTHFAKQCGSRFNNLARFGGHPFLAEEQPVRPLPQFFGWQRLGAAAIAGAANWTAADGGYRADLLAAICRGTVDAITHVWINGRIAWTGEITRAGAASVDFEIAGRGPVTLFWGRPDQPAHPDLAAAGHPAYVGQCYLWMPQFFVGPASGNLPRIEVALKRAPAVSWLAAAPATVNEDANPAVLLAAMLTEPEFGAGMADDLFDQPRWLAAAVTLASEDAVASPLIDRELTLGELIDLLCVYMDGLLHWTPEGKLQLILRRSAPADVAGLPALTAADLVDYDLASRSPKFDRTVVTCVERERDWTPDDGQWLDDGAERSQSIALPWVTRRAAAARLARRAASPGLAGELKVRLSAAAGIAVGDWFTLDVGDGAGAALCVARRVPEGAAPLAVLQITGGRRAEDARELFDRGDVISHDPALP